MALSLAWRRPRIAGRTAAPGRGPGDSHSAAARHAELCANAAGRCGRGAERRVSLVHN
jgi:hypothetical protein